MMSAPRTSNDVSFRVLRVSPIGRQLALLHLKVTTSPCAAPPAAVAVTIICDAPTPVGVATVTKVDPGVEAAADVAVTVTVAGFGATAGAAYSPVPFTVPFPLPPVTAQVTLWLVESFTVAVNCC